MLRLKVRVERIDNRYVVEMLGIANTGFIGIEPEIAIPQTIAKELKLNEITEPEVITKITGDGREIQLLKYRNTVKVYVVTEDRIEGPVLCSVVILPYSRQVLLNDKLLGKLSIVMIDVGDGIWCFRDEVGRKERKSY